MTHKNLVFVYGSLKRKFSNHRILSDENSIFISETFTTDTSFAMFRGSGFPFLFIVDPEHGYKVKGELYSVTDKCVENLDILEGYPDFYNKKEVLLDNGYTAFMYFNEDEIYNNHELIIADTEYVEWSK